MRLQWLLFAISVLILTPNVAFSACNGSLSTSTGHLIGNDNGTVVDKESKLMWKRCLEGATYTSGMPGACSEPVSYNWTDALGRPAIANSGAGFAEKTDWRLPNIKELQSIVEVQCYQPAVNVNAFPNTPAVSNVWSSSPVVSSDSSLYIAFDYGDIIFSSRSTLYSVRLVRDCGSGECD